MRPYLPSVLVSCLISILGLVVLWAGTSGFKAFTTEAERRLVFQEEPKDLTPVLLENQNGENRLLGQTDRSSQVVGFIYTRCPTVCRAMGIEFGQLQTSLKKQGLSDRVELLSVSFDSVNETPQTLAAYLNRHKADTDMWQALRLSDPEQERQILEDFGVTVIPDGQGGFVHNAAFHLVEGNRIVGIYDYGDIRSVVAEISERTGVM